MSAGHIQAADMFDEEDENDSSAAAADTDVTNSDVHVHSNAIQKSSSSSSGISSGGSSYVGNGCWFQYVVTMLLLTTVNLLNYMDRFSVAGQFRALLIPFTGRSKKAVAVVMLGSMVAE